MLCPFLGCWWFFVEVAFYCWLWWWWREVVMWGDVIICNLFSFFFSLFLFLFLSFFFIFFLLFFFFFSLSLSIFSFSFSLLSIYRSMKDTSQIKQLQFSMIHYPFMIILLHFNSKWLHCIPILILLSKDIIIIKVINYFF